MILPFSGIFFLLRGLFTIPNEDFIKTVQNTDFFRQKVSLFEWSENLFNAELPVSVRDRKELEKFCLTPRRQLLVKLAILNFQA